MTSAASYVDAATLAARLVASTRRLAQVTDDLEGEQLRGPQLAIVNPPLWEIGHIAWFQEYWCLRQRPGAEPAPSILAGADALYDSARVAHATRWTLPLPALERTRVYRDAVLDLVLERLSRDPDSAGLRYFVELACLHQDMHAEAFHYTRQTLGYRDPFAGLPAHSAGHAEPTGTDDDIEIAGGPFMLGSRPEDGFVFDNEKWAHAVQVAPFAISRTAVTNEQYRAFVDDGGYLHRAWWSDAGWAWRTSARADAPRYWLRDGQLWQQRRFDEVALLPANHPVTHINRHEAHAYCRYAQRRLPSEAEWEYAAAWDAGTRAKRRYPWPGDAGGDEPANLEGSCTAPVDAYADGDSAAGCRQMLGNVWEWTESVFEAYPGFSADSYREYSEPWFGNHYVLRGGSFATSRRIARNCYRNFYTAERNDIFAGLRTCALRRIGQRSVPVRAALAPIAR